MDSTPIEYSLTGIEIISKQMTEKPPNIGKVFRFGLTMHIRVRREDKKVIPFVNVKVKLEETDETVAEITVAIIFDVPNFDKEILLNKEGLFVIPPQLEHAINPISISTTRGVMYAEFRGTYLNKAILPVIPILSNSPEKKSKDNRKSTS
jgi:hypothetical protein